MVWNHQLVKTVAPWTQTDSRKWKKEILWWLFDPFVYVFISRMTKDLYDHGFILPIAHRHPITPGSCLICVQSFPPLRPQNINMNSDIQKRNHWFFFALFFSENLTVFFRKHKIRTNNPSCMLPVWTIRSHKHRRCARFLGFLPTAKWREFVYIERSRWINDQNRRVNDSGSAIDIRPGRVS